MNRRRRTRARAVTAGSVFLAAVLVGLPCELRAADEGSRVLPHAVAAPIEARGQLQIGFSPWDDIEGMIVARIGSARRELLVQAYLLTSKRIANALIEAHRRGVRVFVLADRSMVFSSDRDLSGGDEPRADTRIPELRNAGIEVRLETRYAAAHNKVMIIDADDVHPIVITGSYNWTRSAQSRNAENVIVLVDHHDAARRYKENWQRHRRDALPYAP